MPETRDVVPVAPASRLPAIGAARARLGGHPGLRIGGLLRYGGLLVVVAVAASTDGFFTDTNLRALAGTASYVGLIAVGMTLVTLSGNLLSLSLGVTASAATLLFLTTLRWGVAPALAAAVAFGTVTTGLQGVLIGWLRANPIIVTIAANSIIAGIALQVTGGGRVAVSGGGFEFLRGTLVGVPVELVIFLVVAAAVQLVLSRLRLGRSILLVGSNVRAATAAGLRPWRTVTGVYAIAGACAGLVGALLAVRFGSTGFVQGRGDGIQFDFDAIAAVLIGGTAIEGGRGSVLRTVVGVVFIVALGSVLLLRGFSTEAQVLAKGVLVAAVIMVAGLEARRRRTS